MARLNDSERAVLLRVARGSIRRAVGDLPESLDLVDGQGLTAELEAPRGVFVTLEKPGNDDPGIRLRGCIGTIHGHLPLYRGVIEMAAKAALQDPRFPPLTRGELDAVRIEISALTPLRPLTQIEELVIGRDGVELRRGSAHAVFLPKVASGRNWDVSELLSQLARKAGLGDDGWAGAELRVFEAEVFGEGAGLSGASAE